MKKLGILLLACVLSVGLAGCGSASNDSANTTENTEISGKVSLDGSTSMEKFVNGLKEAITKKYPNLSLEPQFTGSGTGIQSAIDGTADIGNSSRALKDEEKKAGLVENIVAIDGIAVVVDKNNKVKNLTKDQLVKIYTGQIKNWKEVGGADQKIVVIGREASSGTRGAFEEILKIEEKCKYAQELNETGAVMAAVSATPGAIGYVSLDNVDDSVIAVQLDSVTPSEETVKDGTYTLQRPFVMATKGEIKDQSEQVQAIFDFINSEEGQQVIKAAGLVSPK
jgi:phosphate transport system substrate-binding protein